MQFRLRRAMPCWSLLLILAAGGCGQDESLEVAGRERTGFIAPATITPWLTYYGQSAAARTYVVNYITPTPMETMVVVAADPESLAKVLSDPAVMDHGLREDSVWFEERKAQLYLARGKGPGKGAEILNFRANLHNARIVIRQERFSYAVYVGDGRFSQVYSVLSPSGDFDVLHVGHTAGDSWRRTAPTLIKLVTEIRPAVVLHSGDVYETGFDFPDVRRHTIEPFGPILPTTPLLIAASNHDQGWPQSSQGAYPGLFTMLFHYPYEERSLNYVARYGGWRFLMINYLDIRSPEGAPDVGAMIDRWMDADESPCVVVWGGSDRAIWPKMQAISEKHSRIRLVLGGDGGRAESLALSHGAWLIHNDITKTIHGRFSKAGIDLVTYSATGTAGEAFHIDAEGKSAPASGARSEDRR